jgi:peptidoglycan/xylan/chitin deacetylase (PgdA/CDA1 family)
MLHGVMDYEDSSSQWQPFRSYISRSNLDASLAILSRYVEFISIDTAVDMLSGKLPFEDRHYCVLTFDDGLQNNLTHAMPILRKYDCPAVMYLVTDQIERQEPFWFDRLDYALQHGAHHLGSIEVFGKEVVLNHDTPSTLKDSFLNIKNSAFDSAHNYNEIHNEILRVIKELENRSGRSLMDIYENDPWSKVMTWQDVKSEASSSDITFGSHTVDHSLLGKINGSEIDYQLLKSKEILDKHLPYPCVHFCYPNGSVPQGASKYLQSSGYSTAITTEPGRNLPTNFDRYHLKRFHFPCMDNAIDTVARILFSNR